MQVLKLNIFREHQHENTVVHAWLDEDFEFSAHWHTQLEIVAVLSGNLRAQVNGITYVMNTGDVLLCGSNDIHSYIKSECRILLIIVSPSFIEGVSKELQNNTLLNHCVRYNDLNEEAKILISRIVSEYADIDQQDKQVSSLVFHGYCMTLLGFILNKLDYNPEVQKIKLNMYDYMCRGFEYINNHYCEENINLQTIAQNIGISPCYFSRCFKMYSGYSLTEYINRKRIKKAEKLLKETDKKITEISMECGYGSLRNFNRVYRNITGTAPQQLRSSQFASRDGQLYNL